MQVTSVAPLTTATLLQATPVLDVAEVDRVIVHSELGTVMPEMVNLAPGKTLTVEGETVPGLAMLTAVGVMEPAEAEFVPVPQVTQP